MNGRLVFVIATFVSVASVAVETFAGTNDGWNGYTTVSVSDKAIRPRMSYMYYDKPYAVVDIMLNLPMGFSVEINENMSLNGLDFNSDVVDEFDVVISKKFAVTENTYLKLQISYWDFYSVTKMDKDDALAYDVYLGHNFKCDGRNTLTTEIRAQFWHYIRDMDEDEPVGIVSIMPGLSHECQMNNWTIYDKVGLQWNDSFKPFGELLSAQVGLGVKTKVSNSITWNLLDIFFVAPLTSVKSGDPREEEKEAIAFTTALAYNF